MDETSPGEALTIDQLRLFLAVVDEGSFSAAARALRRAQSAVSYGIANLEKQLDVQLFDRTSRTPSRASLAVSRMFCEAVDAVFMSLLRTLDEPRCPDKYIGTEKFHSIRKFNVVGGKQMVEYHKADDRQRH